MSAGLFCRWTISLGDDGDDDDDDDDDVVNNNKGMQLSPLTWLIFSLS